MFPPFIPPSAQRLQDLNSIALLQRLERYPIEVFELLAPQLTTMVPTAVVMPELEVPSEAAPLLLLHGFDSSLLEFRNLIPRLEPHWPLYALDLLGFGFTAHLSSVVVEPRTIRQHLYYAWKTLINRPVTLLGASLGGAIAIDFALRYPDCVERLILIDSVGFSGSFPLGKWLSSPLLDWGAEWLHFRKGTTLRVIKALPFVGEKQHDLVLCSSLHQEMPGWKEAVMSFTRSGGYAYLAQQISDVRQPTLILWGSQDKTLGTDDAVKFRQAIPQSELVWIEGGDHAPHIFYASAVAETITARQ